MRVIAMPEHGAPATTLETEIPDPQPGEVRVRVHAASVNGFDLAVLAGYLQGDYVTVPVAVGIAPLPEGISFADGGALGLAGTAALTSLDAAADAAGGLEGKTVLIVGAPGGVGSTVVQATYPLADAPDALAAFAAGTAGKILVEVA
jgi:NADPH2:quinone reductase